MTGVCTFAYVYIIQVAIHVVHTAMVVRLADHLNIYSKDLVLCWCEAAFPVIFRSFSS